MLKLYNTLTRKKEKFRPLRKGQVGLYTCGPTVYNFVHLGNFRTYIFQDVLKRALEYAGYKPKHVMNTTDVDDKTIKGAREAGKTLKEFTRYYEKAFKEDLNKLYVKPPAVLVRATEHIPEMANLIKKLLKKGFAYRKDGSVYFAVSKFKPYGKLARLDKKGLKAGARVDADEYGKTEAQDFVLWKSQKPGEPSWRTSFGAGRPGWHIECSAMSMGELGETIDIHTGGTDLIFPHHQNEIAQSEAATGKPFVRYWVHGEHLLVDGKRMAKSLHNFFTLRDIENRGFNPLAFRYLMLTSHYRSKLNFTWESLHAAQRSLNRLYAVVQTLSEMRPEWKLKNLKKKKTTDDFQKKFRAAVENDLDMPKILATIWNMIRTYHRSPESYDPDEVLSALYDFDKVLGLKLKDAEIGKIPDNIQKFKQEREKLRKEKRWQDADAMREKIRRLGYALEDTPTGSRIKPF